MIVALCDVGMATFLFLSGYGVMSSYQKNGLEHYWDKKIKKIYFPAVLVNLFCIFLNFLGGVTLSREDAIEGLLMMCRYNFVNGPTWYINYLFVWYFLFWCINVIAKGNKFKIILYIGISLCMWYIVPAVYPASNYYVFSFTVGVAVALAEEHEVILKLLHKYSAKWIQVLAIMVFIGLLFGYSVIWEIMKEKYPFRIQTIIGIVFVTYGIFAMYVVAKNILKIKMIGKILNGIGTISFGIYLWHYSVMMRAVRLVDESMLGVRWLVAISGFILCCFLAKGINLFIDRIQ